MLVGEFPEKDQINIEKTEKLFADCADLVENCWEDILRRVVAGVKVV